MEKLNRIDLKRIIGVDSLRYVFAIWVFLTHGGRPPLFEGGDKLFDGINKLYGWSINGQAAVIGFFIISGLCIHYPNIYKTKINLRSFYTARFMRLSLPVVVILYIAYLVGYEHDEGLLKVVPIWTIFCEGFYYLIYPILHWFYKKYSVKRVTLFFVVLSIFLLFVWSKDRNMMFHELGENDFLNWKSALLALPCWISGCLLAEVLNNKSQNKKYPSKRELIKWRIGAVVLSTFTFPLYRLGLYLGVIKYPLIGLIFTTQFNILLFGLFSFYWIKKELIYYNFNVENKPNKYFEKFGKGSYSLYLIHTLVLYMFHEFINLYFPGYLISWIILMILVHLVTYVFYFLIEKPSHKLSRYCSKFFNQKNKSL